MKHSKTLLLLPFLALTSCNFISISDAAKVDEQTTSETNNVAENNTDSSANDPQNQSNTDSNNTQNQSSNTQTDNNQQTNQNTDNTQNTNTENNKPINEPIQIDEWQNFLFHEGNEPTYNEYWTFYYGTSKNPNGQLWKNPNEDSECSGVEFKKNSYIISPYFESFLKVEYRFKFWFSSHQSSSYHATNNEPQFKLEVYNNSSTLLETQDIEIVKSDVPSNNTAFTYKGYIRQETATYFILRWNNYIANGDSGYSAILCEASLKGWPYN